MADILKEITDWHNDNGIQPIVLRDVQVGQKTTFGTRVIPKLSSTLSSFDTLRMGMYSGIRKTYTDPDDGHDYSPLYFIHHIDVPERVKDQFVSVYLSVLNGEDAVRVERATMMTVKAAQPIKMLVRKSVISLLHLLSKTIPNYNSLDVLGIDGEKILSFRFPSSHATRLWNNLHPALLEITEPQFSYESNHLTPGGTPLPVREIQSDLYRLVNDILYRASDTSFNRFFDKYDDCFPTHRAGEKPVLPKSMAGHDKYQAMFNLLQVMLGYTRANSMDRGKAVHSGTVNTVPSHDNLDKMFNSMMEFNGLSEKDDTDIPAFLDPKKQWGDDQPPIGDILPFVMVPIITDLETSKYSAVLDYMRLDVAGNEKLRNYMMTNVDNSQHVLARVMILQIIGYIHNMFENRAEIGKAQLGDFLSFMLNVLLEEDQYAFGWQFLSYIDDFVINDDYTEFQLFLTPEEGYPQPYGSICLIVFLDRFLEEGWDISSLNDLDIPEGHSSALKTFLLNVLDIAEQDDTGFVSLNETEHGHLPSAVRVVKTLQEQENFDLTKMAEILPVGILALANSNIDSLNEQDQKDEKRQYIVDFLFNMALSMSFFEGAYDS